MQTLNPEASSASTPNEPVVQTAAEIQTPVESAPQVDAKPQEESSPSKDAKTSEPKSMLEALTRANQEISEEKPTVSSTVESNQVEKSEAAKSPESATTTETPTPEDDSKLPFHNHPRWKAVLQERDAYKHSANQYQLIEKFMADNDLTNDEVIQGYQIMAAMKRDPMKALEMLQPTLESLSKFTGAVLPPDIAEQVDAGTISRDAATELARRRNEAEFHRSERQRFEARQAAQQEQQAINQRNQEIVNAASEWETQIRSRDPDYERKASFINDRIRVLVQAYPPQNGRDALALAQRAYDDVNASLRAAAPKPPMRTVTSQVSNASSAKTEPRSLKEAVFQRAGRAI